MQVSRACTHLLYLYHLSPLASACAETHDILSGNAVIEGMCCTYLERNDEYVLAGASRVPAARSLAEDAKLE